MPGCQLMGAISQRGKVPQMIEPSWIIEEKREICEAVTSLNEVISTVASTYIPLDHTPGG